MATSRARRTTVGRAGDEVWDPALVPRGDGGAALALIYQALTELVADDLGELGRALTDARRS
jgi:hypothetical protein